MKFLPFSLLFLILVLAHVQGQNFGWKLSPEEEVRSDHAVSFSIGLRVQNIDYMEKLLYQISDPHSPFHGKYLTNGQIADLISPPDEEIQTVEDYLTAKSGQVCDVLVSRSIHRDFLHVATCVGQAELIFPNLEMKVYTKENKKLLRSSILMDIDSNSTLLGVPSHLHDTICQVYRITDLPYPHYHPGGGNPNYLWEGNTKKLSYEDMIDFYGINHDGIDPETLQADDGQVRQGVLELNNVAFSPQELETFQKKFDLPLNPVSNEIGTEKTTKFSLEASLDVQTITGMSGNLQTWYMVFNPETSWIEVLEFVMKTDGAPKVFSVSWVNYDSDFTEAKIKATNIAFMKFVLAGFTFVEGAGDWGPTLSTDCKHYDPEFPTTSPYVLSVGGAKINKTTNMEEAWIHSSGGFSRRVERPDFQKAKVEKYLANAKLPPNQSGDLYKTNGSVYPDISGFGAFQVNLANNEWEMVCGTSAATPQVAAMLALINVHRYQNGLGPVGFVNKTLWELDSVGVDVTQGISYATSPTGVCPDILPGYETAVGWDPVTGLGVIKFDVLFETFVKTPLKYTNRD